MDMYPCKGDREFDFMTIGEKNVVLEEMLEKAEKELVQKEVRIRELEDVINWLAEFMVNSDDDITIGEICICYNDPSLDIYMACPICSENSPLYVALEKARKEKQNKLEEV